MLCQRGKKVMGNAELDQALYYKIPQALIDPLSDLERFLEV